MDNEGLFHTQGQRVSCQDNAEITSISFQGKGELREKPEIITPPPRPSRRGLSCRDKPEIASTTSHASWRWGTMPPCDPWLMLLWIKHITQVHPVMSDSVIIAEPSVNSQYCTINSQLFSTLKIQGQVLYNLWSFYILVQYAIDISQFWAHIHRPK